MTNDDAVFEQGKAIRQDMWGTDGLAPLERATDFNRDFEELVTRYCFGEVWGREELSRAQRSMLTLGLLVALGKPNQLRVHVKGAIANGVTKEQIREVLMHSAIYCGIPAAVEGFRNAAEALDELGES
jgi:4-carboxymuconolactone decarboxylase